METKLVTLLSPKKIFKELSFKKQFLKAFRLFHFNKIVPEPLLLKKVEKCLVLSPHPDDETFGCGGAMSKYPGNFEVVCLTDGRHGGHCHEHIELIETRKKEFVNSMAILGVESYSFLGIEDRKLLKFYEEFKKIDISTYDYVFIPNFFDQHKDHKAVTVLLQKLLREVKYKKGLKIAFFEVWSPLPINNFFVDITPNMNKKIEAVNCFNSQNKYTHFQNGITGINYFRGMQSSIEFAEAFAVFDVKTFLNF